MERREFNRQLLVAVIAIPAARMLAACTSDNQTLAYADLSTPTSPGPVVDAASQPADLATTSPADLAMGSITYVSSNVAGHAHTVTLEVTLFSAPPSAGITRETSVASSHSHSVSLTMQELQAIAAGGTVSKDTTLVQSHTHTFVFTNQG